MFHFKLLTPGDNLIIQVSTGTSTHTHKKQIKSKANHWSLQQVTGACKRVNNEHSFFIHTSPLSGIASASPPYIHFQLFLTTGEVPSAAKVSFILFITHSGGEHFYFQQITYPVFHSSPVLQFTAFDRPANATPILWAMSGKTHFHASCREDCWAMKYKNK